MFNVISDNDKINDILLRMKRSRDINEIIVFPEEYEKDNSFFMEVKNLAFILYCANNDIPCRVLLNAKSDIPDEVLEAVRFSKGGVRVYRFRDMKELTSIADAINEQREEPDTEIQEGL